MSAIATLTSPPAIWLFIWMINNIGVTLLNKAAFAKVHFPYPWLLSAIHMICNYMGSMLIFWTLQRSNRQYNPIPKKDNSNHNSSTTTNGGLENNDKDLDEIDEVELMEMQKQLYEHDPPGSSNSSNGYPTPQSKLPLAARLLGGHIERKILDRKGYRFMMAFSVLFSFNIAIGNVSLNYVSVNFNQVMRSLVPAVTIALGIMMGKTFSTNRKIAVIPIMTGVAMACFGDMTYTMIGFLVTCFCVVLAALKAVASGEMLTGDLKLHPVDLLAHMAPLAMIQCFFVSICTGEINTFLRVWDTELNPFTVSPYPMLIVWMSGFASFTLNISSLQANKLTSPLTLCIAANVKQVLMILLGTVIFETPVTFLNGTGIVVVLGGSAWYSYVCVAEKQQQPTTTSTTSSTTKSVAAIAAAPRMANSGSSTAIRRTDSSSSGVRDKDHENEFYDDADDENNNNDNDDDDNDLKDLLEKRPFVTKSSSRV